MNEQEKNPDKDKDEKYRINNYLIPSRKKLYRSPHNYIFFGVSGGIAEYMNVSPFFIRTLFVITAVLGGWGIVAYAFCFFLIPEHPSVKEKGKLHRINSRKFFGLLLIGIGSYYWLPFFGIFRLLDSINFNENIVFSIVLLVAGLYLVLQRERISLTEAEKKPIKLYRANGNRRLLGLCEGLSIYLNTDVNLIRMMWVLLSFVTIGLTGIIYFILAYFIPNEIDEA